MKSVSSDRALTATVDEGAANIVVAVDHCTIECVCLHAAKKAARFEAREPLRQAVRDYCGGFRPNAAMGKKNTRNCAVRNVAQKMAYSESFLTVAPSGWVSGVKNLGEDIAGHPTGG